VEASFLEPLRERINRRFAPRRHSVLLIAVVALLSVRVLLGNAAAGPIVFSLAFLILMLVALYNVNIDEVIEERNNRLATSKRRWIIGWALATIAILGRLAIFFVRDDLTLNLVSSISWILFFAFVVSSQLRSVLRQTEVTGETISMSVSIYLLLGLTWGLLYIIIFELQPGAFSFGGAAAVASSSDPLPIFPILTYFSLTTLSTIGFGDITPVTLQARYAAVTEGIAGQFYLAILVARLVGMQMSQAANDRVSPQ
jgi:voltage-gated potassium channel